MKILFVSNLFPPNVVGGYERLAHGVSEALADRGHTIEVLTSDYGKTVQTADRYPVHRKLVLAANRHDIYAPTGKSHADTVTDNTQNIIELDAVLQAFKPDLVFVWNLFFLDASLIRHLESTEVPSVMFLTDNWLIAAQTPTRIHEFFSRFVQGKEVYDAGVDLVQAEMRYSLKSAAIFGAYFMQSLYRSCGYDFGSQWTIHNGVQLPSLLEHVGSLRSPIDRKRVRLLFAGRIVDLKAPDLCVRALKPLRDMLGPNVELSLTIVGDGQAGDYRKVLEDCIRADTSGARIEIRPAVSEADLPTLWAEHDIYLFPSTYEPFALTLILALAAGIPTVASRAGGNGEIVLDEGTGLTFATGNAEDMASKIARLVREPGLAEALSQRGSRMARKFTFHRMIDQVETRLLEWAGR